MEPQQPFIPEFTVRRISDGIATWTYVVGTYRPYVTPESLASRQAAEVHADIIRRDEVEE